jgi:hypothetical protein
MNNKEVPATAVRTKTSSTAVHALALVEFVIITVAALDISFGYLDACIDSNITRTTMAGGDMVVEDYWEDHLLLLCTLRDRLAYTTREYP